MAIPSISVEILKVSNVALALCSISSLLIITKYGMLILNLFWDITARLGSTKSILWPNTGGQEV